MKKHCEVFLLIVANMTGTSVMKISLFGLPFSVLLSLFPSKVVMT